MDIKIHPAGALLQRVLEASQNAVIVYEAVRSTEGVIIDLQLQMANKVFEAETGLSLQELIGQPFSENNAFLGHTGLFERYCEVLKTGKADRFEVSFTPPIKAHPVWHDVSVVRFDDSIVISYTDITELKKHKEALQEAEVLRNSFSAALSGITVFEPIFDQAGRVIDFRFVMINAAGLRMSGLSQDQVIGRTIRDFYPQTDTYGLFTTYVRVYNTGEPFTGEHYYADFGIWREVSIVAVIGGIMVSYNDITERKKAQLAQQNQAELLETIIQHTQVGLTVFQAIRNISTHEITDFAYVLTNPANATQVNRPVDELLNQSILNLFPGVKQTLLYQNLMAVMNTGAPKRFLFPYFNEGIKGWFDCTLVKIGDAVLLSSMDVSDSYHHQQQLEFVNRELRLSNDNLQQFAYVASHDLQEPLRKIQSFGELLISQFSSDLHPSAVDIIRRMYSASERMSILIRDLLVYSRISTHREPFKLVNLKSLVAAITEDLELSIQKNNADIKIDKLPDVLGDDIQLRQLFQNLLSNALKFHHPDSTPVIHISSRLVVGAELDQEPLSEIIIESKFSDGRRRAYHEISISDNGIGFDERYTDRIFQVFQRLHGRSQYEGSGIGLAICKKVIDNHRGAITAYSQPGKGSRFVIYLPIQR